MSSRRYISPLRYPGGKARIVPFLTHVLASQFDDGVEVWVEPFAGGAGAGLALLDSGAVGELWLTEKNPAIAALWQTVLAEPDALAARVEGTVPDLALFYGSREIVASAAEHEIFDVAFAALVLNRCSRSGIVAPRVGPIGGRAQSGPWTVRSRWNGSGLAERIRYVGSMSGSIRFTHGDALDTINDLRDCGVEDEVMLFVDPPYLREGNRLYFNGMSLEDHRSLAAALHSCPARWLLTYDDEPVVFEELYPRSRVMAYAIPNTANRQRVATEYVVLSDTIGIDASAPPVVPGFDTWWVRGDYDQTQPWSVSLMPALSA